MRILGIRPLFQIGKIHFKSVFCSCFQLVFLTERGIVSRNIRQRIAKCMRRRTGASSGRLFGNRNQRQFILFIYENRRLKLSIFIQSNFYLCPTVHMCDWSHWHCRICFSNFVFIGLIKLLYPGHFYSPPSFSEITEKLLCSVPNFFIFISQTTLWMHCSGGRKEIIPFFIVAFQRRTVIFPAVSVE